jgi:hypothetical protein
MQWGIPPPPNQEKFNNLLYAVGCLGQFSVREVVESPQAFLLNAGSRLMASQWRITVLDNEFSQPKEGSLVWTLAFG